MSVLIAAAILWKIYMDKSPKIKIVDGKVHRTEDYNLKVSIVAEGLNVPWELIWGPDNKIWFTQRNGFIKRLDPKTGSIHTLLKIVDSHQFTSSGTLGMVLHPKFPDEPYLYVIYTYLNENSIMEKCVRYTYDVQDDTLVEPFPILNELSTGVATYGARILCFDNYLFISSGHGVTPNGYRKLVNDTIDEGGYVFRLNLDGTIPHDNPWEGSPVFAFGFRNPQGLAVSAAGNLYVSDHGPSESDEINIVVSGGSYGWPYVRGACDDRPFENEKFNCDLLNTVEPVFEWTPTIAPCGLEYYNNDLIPTWNNSLILLTLKESDLRVLKLSEDGTKIINESIYLDGTYGRLRDLCVSPDGRIFISTSNSDHDGGDDHPAGNNNAILMIEPADFPITD